MIHVFCNFVHHVLSPKIGSKSRCRLSVQLCSKAHGVEAVRGPDHCRCLARKKGLWAPWETDTIYQTYLVLYTLMARYCNYDITWTNHVCTRRPAATANKDSKTKGNRNETNERIRQVPGKRVPTFFGIFAPGFATSSASFSLLQGVLSCSEFLGMEHGAIRSAPWIKWVDWIVHHMNCE